MSQAAASIYHAFAHLPKGKELGQVLQGQLASLTDALQAEERRLLLEQQVT